LTSAPTSSATLLIYHTSDVHDRRGFGAKLSQVVEPGALLFDSGDALRGSSTIYHRVEPVMLEFAAAPYRAQAVGNREFHYLHRCMLARAKAMPVPWVCSNVVDLRGRERVFDRELRMDVAGFRLRIFGLLVPQYRTGSWWESVFGWRFLSPEAALNELLAQAPPSGEVVVVLSHLGLAADRALARRFPQIGAILGGHSHDALEKPEIVDGVPIVHPGAFARYAGRLELMRSDDGYAVRSYRLVPLLEESAA
jgi:2',3'-cyclic-nucleotide 2'-phosphodiesterase (5'-nucleotidase family)